jgi:formylglycine-generating enzyme required for sulfatase activity
MGMHRLAILLVVLASTIWFTRPGFGQQRFALLIGNQAYTQAVGPLKNPYNDVARVGRALAEVGFTVLDPLKDATRDDMLFGVYKLAELLRKAGPGAVGFLYYTGHGIAVGGENVLIPKNVETTTDAELNVRGVRLTEVVDILKNNAPDAVHFVVLDACRNNIRGQKGAKGFVPVNDQRAGVVLAFATAAGQTASDDGASSGPYAAALAEEIVVPGRNDQAVFNTVRSRVVSVTGHRQTPWTHDGLIGERIVFKPLEAQRSVAIELTYKNYIEAFEAQRPILKGSLFPREALGELVYSVLERSTEQFKGKTWDGGDDWGRIAFDEAGRLAKYYEPSGREAGQILIQGVMSDSGHSFAGTRGVLRSAELAGEWHQNDKKGEGGFILKFVGQDAVMSWGPLFRRESRWRPTSHSSSSTASVHFSEAAEAWSATKDTTSTAVLEAFIVRYKDTFYAEIARARIEELKKQQVAVTVPPNAPAAQPAPAITRPPAGCEGIEAQVGNDKRCLKPMDTFKDCHTCPEMVVMPVGSFTMGSPRSEEGRNDNEDPQHKVIIAKLFAVGKFAANVDEWDACVAGGGCNGTKLSNQSWVRERPVINVSWNDTKAYVSWLSAKTGKTYRLLSEAEREYVARAGTTTPFWWGSSISTKQANFNGNYAYGGGAKGEYRQITVAVDSFEPNAWGLYNVHGNVWEWVEDCWHENYQGAPVDGSAWITGECKYRVLRGGSWVDDPRLLRSAKRDGITPVDRRINYGFRLARTLSP